MPFVFVPAAASFPQIADLRTVGSVIDDLLDYTGGADRPEARARARRALAESVREFNNYAWRFKRKTTDVTFLDETSEYALPALTRDVWKVMFLDSANLLVGDLGFVPYEDFLRYDGSTLSPTQEPDEYTTHNTFGEGLIRFLPRIGTGTFTNPKARVFYHEWLQPPTDDAATLVVPMNVETALVQNAAAILIARTRSFEEARAANLRAAQLKFEALREWRDFPDFMAKMG